MARVLLLDDRTDLALVISAMLRERGNVVVHARTVEEARSVVDGSFDAYVCDYGLPDGTGVDFLADLPAEGLRILWSGVDRKRDVEKSGVHGDHVLSKMNPALMLALVETAPRRQGG